MKFVGYTNALGVSKLSSTERTSFENARLRTEVSTSLCPDMRKYIWESMPERDDVEPANVFFSAFARSLSAYRVNQLASPESKSWNGIILHLGSF